MNDRREIEIISAAVSNSPGYLLQELGLTKVLLLRPGRMLEKNGIINPAQLDQDIRNRGRGWIFRPTKKEEWAQIYLFNRSNTYQCHWIEFDYTRGTFHFGMTQTGMARNCCTPFLIGVSELPKVRLLPVRHCDIV